MRICLTLGSGGDSEESRRDETRHGRFSLNLANLARRLQGRDLKAKKEAIQDEDGVWDHRISLPLRTPAWLVAAIDTAYGQAVPWHFLSAGFPYCRVMPGSFYGPFGLRESYHHHMLIDFGFPAYI